MPSTATRVVGDEGAGVSLGGSLGGLALLSIDSAVILAMLVYEQPARRRMDRVPAMSPQSTGGSGT